MSVNLTPVYAITLAILAGLAQTAFAVNVPMQLDNQHWQALEYRSIPANRVTQLEQGLKIQVDASASPLIYVFDETKTISEVSVMGMIGQLPVIPAGLQQGEKGADDFPFRLGLVLEGDKTLNFAQELLAAQWVKILFNLAPEESGIDHIMFLNLANSGPSNIFNAEREHPHGNGLYTELIIERVFAERDFNFNYELPMPERVIALWISADGDDTGSKYALTVNSISYK